VHLKTLLTYFKSHKKAIANSVEQQKKIKESTGKRSIAGWLRNTAVVHRTIRRCHTQRRKREEKKTSTTTNEYKEEEGKKNRGHSLYTIV
jgi:hypothetical protein